MNIRLTITCTKLDFLLFLKPMLLVYLFKVNNKMFFNFTSSHCNKFSDEGTDLPNAYEIGVLVQNDSVG